MKRKNNGTSGFALEDHLLRVIQRKLSRQVVPKDTQKILSFPKLQVGMIVPDFVVVAMRSKPSPKASVRSPLSFFECAIIAELLKRGSASSEGVAEQLYARESTLGKAVARLKRRKILIKNKRGELAVRSQAFPVGIKVISVEAKLRKWKEALEQAKEYRQFSNCAYIALPKQILQNNRRIQIACRADGIGLVAVSAQGPEILLRAKNALPKSAEWVWLVAKTTSIKRRAKAR